MLQYHQDMTQMERMNVRLSAIQRAWLKRLAEKLQIDQANVIRVAITRLAEEEGIAGPGKRPIA